MLQPLTGTSGELSEIVRPAIKPGLCTRKLINECILRYIREGIRLKTVRHRQKTLIDGTGERLLLALAEQIKTPFLQIARQAELARSVSGSIDLLSSIELTADSALKLIDNYLLSTKLARMHATLQLEPVSVAAIMNETAHQLEQMAKQYECELELHVSGRYEPVMAHKEGLRAALTSLGYVFIEAQSGQPHKHRPVIKLAAHRSKYGIVTGMFANMEGLGTDMYRRAHNLYGHTRQPLTQAIATAGAGVFVADSLLSSMATHLRIAHHQKLTGLAATFVPSQQLSLV